MSAFLERANFLTRFFCAVNSIGETHLPVPQPILDALTDVAMPRLPSERAACEFLDVGGFRLPVHRADALVIGSGAAGLRAAVEMKRRGVEAMIATQSAWGGTSACSGSDKQTLHTANTADHGDDFRALAAAISAGGAMDAGAAYVEAVGSPRALATLQFLGLPLPLDRYGGVLRYQTDHDEVGRATSCGPRTSRLMVQALAREALRLDILIVNHTAAVRLLVDEGRAQGALAINPKLRTDDNPLGFVVFLSRAIVLAAGGPGELYRDSVYPRGCFGALGLALEAGVEAVNLTESQFGIGTAREGFPWNLSGTYVQAMPYVFSRDSVGREFNFLAGYYRTTQELASNTFRKGYQWPFHATRMLDFQSSLFDLAVIRERQAGRRVFLDFNRNPQPVEAPFSLDALDADVRRYLDRAGALLATPIERLAKMNPLSIELYKRYKRDIAREPLEFAVNNQHMNGGLAVDVWGQTSLGGCYAVGETAGTHGVTRPGGAALNAGQVFATRAAEHIAARLESAAPNAGLVERHLVAVLAALKSESPIHAAALREQVQARMSDHAGVFCTGEAVAAARAQARALNRTIAREGVAFDGATGALRALQWRHMALASEAVLTALDAYIRQGGGSRGARAVLDAQGDCAPEARATSLEAYRFRRERLRDRDEQLLVRREGDGFSIRTQSLRARDADDKPFFERDWPDYLTGAIYATKAGA